MEVSIPFARIPVLIGKGGSTKRKIEEIAGVRMAIAGNAVSIEGDALHAYMAESVVKAIGRGFHPEIALQLLDDDYSLEILEFPQERNHRVRIRARVIGREGRVRKKIEEMTGVRISVYGKTVSIIGRMDDVEIAKEAISMIIKGSKHSNVFSYISRRKEERWLF